jgi:hypothetical protein
LVGIVPYVLEQCFDVFLRTRVFFSILFLLIVKKKLKPKYITPSKPKSRVSIPKVNSMSEGAKFRYEYLLIACNYKKLYQEQSPHLTFSPSTSSNKPHTPSRNCINTQTPTYPVLLHYLIHNFHCFVHLTCMTESQTPENCFKWLSPQQNKRIIFLCLDAANKRSDEVSVLQFCNRNLISEFLYTLSRILTEPFDCNRYVLSQRSLHDFTNLKLSQHCHQ